MSEDLKPGLYRANVRGERDVVVLVDDDGTGFTVKQPSGAYLHPGGHVTDARPLIVIEAPEDARDNHFPRLVAYLRNGGWDLTADQIEAQTKPARIPEPGLWGVVEAYEFPDRRGARRTFIHTCSEPDWPWGADGDTNHWKWDDLIDPTLIREGVN